MIERLLALSRRKFVRDTFTLQLTTLVQGGTYLLTSVLTARYLGAHDLGRWVTTREIYMFAYFLVSTGVLNATISRYSAAVGGGDRGAAVQALAGLLKIGTVTTALLIVLGVTLGPLAGEHFYADRELGVFAAILTLSGAFEVLRSLVVAALQGSRQMVRYAYLDMTSNLVRVGLVWIALASGFGIPAVVASFVLHMAVTGALAIGAYHRARRGDSAVAPPPLREVLAAVPRAPVRFMFGLSYLIALNKGMNTLVPRLGMLLIPAHLLDHSMATNGAYSVAYVLAWAVALGLTGVSQALLPAVGHKMGSDGIDFEQMGGVLRRVSLASGIFMAAATLLSVPLMYPVIRYGYGAEYGDAFRYYLWIAAGNLFLGFSVVIDSFYIYSGQIRKVIPWNLLLAGLAAVAMVVASNTLGPTGVAAVAGMCRWLSAFHLVYIWWYFRRLRHLRAATGDAPAVATARRRG